VIGLTGDKAVEDEMWQSFEKIRGEKNLTGVGF
jgi:hypothetical protein